MATHGRERRRFPGSVAVDALYEGPYGVLSAVDHRPYKRMLYEVLHHAPTHDAIEAFRLRLKTALEERALHLEGITADGSALSPEPIVKGFGEVPHQLCTFHVIAELVKGVVMAVASHPVFTRTLLTCFSITAAVLTTSYLLNTVLPRHLVTLGGSQLEVGMLVSAMTLVSMILRPMVGGWTDRYGARPVMLVGTLILTFTSVAFNFARAPIALILLMGGIGLSSGILSTSSVAVVARSSSAKHRGETLSVYYLAANVPIAIGPAIGFALYGLGGMRLAFVFVTSLSILIAVLVMSLPGGRSVAAAGPATRFRLLSPYAHIPSCTLVLLNIGYASIYPFLPLHTNAHGMANASWFFALYSGLLIACRICFRGLSDRLGRSRVLVPVIAMMVTAYFILALDPGYASLVAAAVLLGAGTSVMYPTMVALVVDRTPEAERGLAVGTLLGALDLGAAIGAGAVGFVVQRTGSYGAGFFFTGIMGVLALALFLSTEGRRVPWSPSARPSR